MERANSWLQRSLLPSMFFKYKLVIENIVNILVSTNQLFVVISADWYAVRKLTSIFQHGLPLILDSTEVLSIKVFVERWRNLLKDVCQKGLKGEKWGVWRGEAERGGKRWREAETFKGHPVYLCSRIIRYDYYLKCLWRNLSIWKLRYCKKPR